LVNLNQALLVCFVVLGKQTCKLLSEIIHFFV